MNALLRFHFWLRRAAWRTGASLRLVVHLVLIALGVVLAIEVGQILVTFAVAAAALVALVIALGSFTERWRHAGVRVGQQYRRLTHRSLTGKDAHR